jgi:hypothetical protein
MMASLVGCMGLHGGAKEVIIRCKDVSRPAARAIAACFRSSSAVRAGAPSARPPDAAAAAT